MATKLMAKDVGKNVIRGLKKFEDIPGPPCWPLVGSALMYRFGDFKKTQYHEALKDMYCKYGPLVKENIGGKIIVHVFDPEDIKTVYSYEGKYPVVPPLQETTQMYRAQKQMSLGLGNTNGEEWYKLRSNCIQKMLRPKEVAFHLPSVDKTAKMLIDKIQQEKNANDEIEELRIEIGKWSIENAANLVFDRQLDCLTTASERESWARDMVEANAEIFKLSGDLKLSLPLYKYLSTPKWRKLVAAEDSFYSEAISLVDEALLRLTAGVEKGTLSPSQLYFLSYLISRDSLDLKDVTVICLSLFTDGLSTTTPTLLFNLYALARNPEVQEKVFQEVEKNLPLSSPATVQALANLPYLKAFVKETFRMYPNGTEVSRYLEEDISLSGFQIPAGTHVDLNPSVHFMDPHLFPNPSKHLPERWLREDAEQNIHPYLLTPFGHGTRMCAGRRFAEQDLYVVIARIIARFKLSVPDEPAVNQIYHTLLFPDTPLHIQFRNREEA
ncbi:probable cytochrome P450 CYP44 isoform X2 [Eurytemora carolleeae]|uniref:probable cytochrome P450 CYP44 isoform X2 n=1 Tax=Eurytemora carolleeae TaxID=1294199 RepID=UPI000C7764EF|nr:probable cytochrome P450 CYP44 isoform X2 [Eurytemora carolleeae]|eukprot:XP_023330089.1 probable cytochrome P450 CYP44 isoform X2 [Eurytemora affinis]